MTDSEFSVRLPLADETHLWQLYWPQARQHQAEWGAWLSAAEQARAQRFVRAVDRDRFQISRAGLRWLLSRYLGWPPQALAFTYGDYGKPQLQTPACSLGFNLAHSGPWVMYGISCCPWIGVDVEVQTQRLRLEALIHRCLTPEEQAALPLAPTPRLQAFLQYWTIKEAHLKAVGIGLSYPMTAVQVAWQPTPYLVRPAIAPSLPTGPWTVQLWQPDAHAIAAVCVAQSNSRILRRGFPRVPEINGGVTAHSPLTTG